MYMKLKQKNFFQTGFHAKTNGTVLSKVHGIHKGVNLNIRPEKQVMKPLSA